MRKASGIRKRAETEITSLKRYYRRRQWSHGENHCKAEMLTS
jgi:hypothetical protein